MHELRTYQFTHTHMHMYMFVVWPFFVSSLSGLCGIGSTMKKRICRMVVFEFCCFPNLLPNSSWLWKRERSNFVVGSIVFVVAVVAVDVTVTVCPQNQNLPKIQLVKDKNHTERIAPSKNSENIAKEMLDFNRHSVQQQWVGILDEGGAGSNGGLIKIGELHNLIH